MYSRITAGELLSRFMIIASIIASILVVDTIVSMYKNYKETLNEAAQSKSSQIEQTLAPKPQPSQTNN